MPFGTHAGEFKLKLTYVTVNKVPDTWTSTGFPPGFERYSNVVFADRAARPSIDRILVTSTGRKAGIARTVRATVKFEAVTFDAGHIDTAHFADYRLPRFSDMPTIDTVLVNRIDLPSAGAGETPIVGIAPAVANAIFDATGVRLRSLPLVPNGLPSGTGSQM